LFLSGFVIYSSDKIKRINNKIDIINGGRIHFNSLYMFILILYFQCFKIKLSAIL